jgi:hypothetical protein
MKRDGVDEDFINIEEYFKGMKYMKCEGLEDLGKPKNIYTETYADADYLRVHLPENVKREATTIKFTFAFAGENRTSVYGLFNEYITNAKIQYYDTARYKEAYMINIESSAPKDDIYIGSTPYMTVEYTFKNLYGKCIDLKTQ